MERIKDALEKASKQKEAAAASSPAVPMPAKVDNLARFPVTNQPYGQVRRIKLDMGHLEDNRIVALRKNDPHCAYFDRLRTQVLQSMQAKDWHTLAITSPTVECGKTFVAINLAMSIAQQPNRECILVDFDLRLPNVARILGLKMGQTLSDYFLESAKIEDIIVGPEVQDLFIIPNAAPVQSPSEILSGQKTADLINDLRSRYPNAIVIFDLPPLLAYDDVVAFLPSVDCALMVVASGQTKVADIEACDRQLQGSKYLGVVINKSSEPIKKSEYHRY